MTGEEKRREMKEQYKRDLKLRKEFLEKAKTLRSQQNINKAISEMMEGMNDDSDDWINQLNQETALTEAKFEMALDQAKEAEQKLKDIANEAEMKRLQAESLVQQMKRDMGLLPEIEIEVEAETTEVEAETETEATAPTDQADSPETSEGVGIGEEPPSPEPPRKTLGDF